MDSKDGAGTQDDEVRGGLVGESGEEVLSKIWRDEQIYLET